MALAPPPYMPVAALQAMPVSHGWDDWDPYPLVGDPDPAVEAALRRVSQRAKKAFATACAEWVWFRLARLYDSPSPRDYLEASWASVVDWALAYVWEPGHEHCDGPVRGPIDMAIRTLTNTHNALELAAGEVDAALLAKLALHVMPQTGHDGAHPHAPGAFLAWQKEALGRLQALYPLDPREPFGPPVPRQALDPGVPLAEVAPDRAGPLLRAFLNGLDFDRNEFLIKPGPS
jgi:hypothetical protein